MAAITKYQKLGDIIEIYYLPVLETESVKSRRMQGRFFPRTLKEGYVPGLSLWLADSNPCVHRALSLHTCLQSSSLYKNISQIRAHSIVFLLTKSCIFKQVYILRYQGLRGQHRNVGCQWRWEGGMDSN